MQSSKGTAVYIHIPFCKTACPYCNFNFRLIENYDETFIESYVEALETEFHTALDGEFSGNNGVYSIFFGGGTPSLLHPEQVGRLISTINPQNLPMEVTSEANPEGLQRGLSAWKKAGINRLSLGMQSLNPKILKYLGRNHTPGDVQRCVEEARLAGFDNVSLDLMGCVPGQSLQELQDDLAGVLLMTPEHVSYYGLTIEEKTVFHVLLRRGELRMPDETLQSEFYDTVRNSLTEHGFQHYEISNFARPGFESRHNEIYWTYSGYLGLGAGAHSFVADSRKRRMNVEDPKAYVRAVRETGKAPKWQEDISESKAMGEMIFTGLRRLNGIELSRFSETFGRSLEEVYAKELAQLTSLNLIEVSGQSGGRKLQLTPKGVLLSDSVFEQFVTCGS